MASMGTGTTPLLHNESKFSQLIVTRALSNGSRTTIAADHRRLAIFLSEYATRRGPTERALDTHVAKSHLWRILAHLCNCGSYLVYSQRPIGRVRTPDSLI